MLPRLNILKRYLFHQVVIVVKSVVTVDKANPDTNFAGDDLTVGSPDGTPDTEKRVIIEFDVESFDEGY